MPTESDGKTAAPGPSGFVAIEGAILDDRHTNLARAWGGTRRCPGSCKDFAEALEGKLRTIGSSHRGAYESHLIEKRRSTSVNPMPGMHTK